MDLFDAPRIDAGDGVAYDRTLGQWMTPAYVAEAICAHVLGDRRDLVVVEPGCGIGRFLAALPPETRAIGVEIDPRLADIARANTGREVVTGDFARVELPVDRADLVLGNPDFGVGTVDALLARSAALLEEGGEVALILPTSIFQTSSRVVRYNRTWSLGQTMMPRNMFPGISLPLMLARFVKDRQPRMTGFLLYHEVDEVMQMPDVYRRALEEGRSGWRAVVERALQNLGGEASVEQVCAEIAPRRPTGTQHWRPKVRQQLGLHFTRIGPARYATAA